MSTLLIAALVFLFKSWISERLKNAIKHEYDQKLEAHKATLQRDTEIAIEKLKSRLNLVALEHSVKFSRLDSKRADTVEKIYSLLVRFHRSTHIFVSVAGYGNQSKEEELNVAKESLSDLMRYFLDHQIYLPQDLCDQIQLLISSISRKASEFGLFVEVGEEALSPKARVAMDRKWNEVSEYFDREVPVLKKNLESELRRILEPKSQLDLE